MLVRDKRTENREYEKDYEILRSEQKKRVVTFLGLPVFTMTYKYNNNSKSENDVRIGFQRGDK